MKLAVGGALLALAAGRSTPAAAAYTFDWHGTVGGGISSPSVFDKDDTSIFGAGFDLVGQAITVPSRSIPKRPGRFTGTAPTAVTSR